MAVMIRALVFAVDFFIHFMVVGFIAFMSFTLAGYILFGEQLYGWSTAGMSITSLFSVLFSRFEYNDLHSVAPITAACWFWGCYVFIVIFLMNVLLAAVVHRYSDVQRRLGEPGNGVFEQLREMLRELAFLTTYEGAQKSIPYDLLLMSLMQEDGMNERQARKAANLKLDRRLRTRKDLAKEEADPKVDVAYLQELGCDETTAEHLLERCQHWCNRIAMTADPAHHLVVEVAKHMHKASNQAEGLRERLRSQVNFAASKVDKIDLKHAKCYSVAKRVRKAQIPPVGWTVHYDAEGRRYLRHEQSGLTSWTLPKTSM
jgi:hypothetical protein